MKILTWNCSGAFRKKFHLLDQFQADILIIQECEDPAVSKDKEYLSWAKKFQWVGDNKHKGLAIFVRQDIELKLLDWSHDGLKYFIPCRINNKFNLIACWCHGANSPTFGYIGQLWKYMQLHKNKFETAVLAGDLNSNVIWDKWDRWWNHSDVLRELNEIEIKSLYHHFTKEEAGKELIPTFFHRKDIKKPYHIDYLFGSSSIKDDMTNFTIGNVDEWLQYSDHMPILCELKQS